MHIRVSSGLGVLIVSSALWIAGAASAGVPSSWAEAALDEGDARVEARLLIHPDPAAAGSVRAGVLFSLDPGWHLYWKNPGESGLPTRLAWRGGAAGPLAWPAPTAFEEGEGTLVSYGYEGHVLLASELRPDPDARAVGVDVDLLVCRTSCIPARLSLERSLDAVDSGEAADAVRRLFQLHDESLPRSAEALGVTLDASLAGASAPTEIALAVLPCDGAGASDACRALAAPPTGPVFFPEGVELRVLDVRAHPQREGGLLVRFESETGAPGPLRGVLALRGDDGRVHQVAVDLAARALASRSGEARLFATLALALLGGLLLNLMPCVLPVLARKAFTLAELASRSRRESLAHGAAYTAGVLVTMLVLASVVLLLRLAGSEVGRGFQFQSPPVLVTLSALLVTFALNLFGVFEIGQPSGLAGVGAGAVGVRRSLLEGLLAVALAAPCSAPFLGTAVGFALASGGPLVPATFLAVGVGFAAPCVLISAFPISAKWLPRSGPWMLELKRALGFALLASVVWLVWLLGRSAGADAAAGLLALLLAVGLVAWGYGRTPRRGLRAALLATGSLLLLAGANVITIDEMSPPVAARPKQAFEAWQPATVERYLAEGRPVFVYFTADWCLTCKFNEQSVLAKPEVHAALQRGGFAVLRADWTQRDERIRHELARFGKAGVPLYVVHHPGASQPRVLPELLSPAALLDALGSELAAPAAGDSDRAQGMREAGAS